MRTLITPLLALGLALLVGCSTDQSDEGESGTRILSADQVQLLPPAQLGKRQAIDIWQDFTLDVVPSSSAQFQDESFKLKVKSGAVESAMTITADNTLDDDMPTVGYDFGPEGYEFERSLDATWKIRPEDLPEDIDWRDIIVLLDLEDGTYEMLQTKVKLRDDKIQVRAKLDHFSKYVLGTGPPPEAFHLNGGNGNGNGNGNNGGGND